MIERRISGHFDYQYNVKYSHEQPIFDTACSGALASAVDGSFLITRIHMSHDTAIISIFNHTP